MADNWWRPSPRPSPPYGRRSSPGRSPPARSAPEQNAPPAPATTTQRSVVEAAISRKVLSSSPHMVLLIALRRSGRLRVTVTTPSSRDTSSVSTAGEPRRAAPPHRPGGHPSSGRPRPPTRRHPGGRAAPTQPPYWGHGLEPVPGSPPLAARL